MKRAAVIIKDPHQQYEGLRISVGLLLAGMTWFRCSSCTTKLKTWMEAYQDNMVFMDEIGGKRFSNNSENAEKYGFSHVTMDPGCREDQTGRYGHPLLGLKASVCP
jgi:hypothetical protein